MPTGPRGFSGGRDPVPRRGYRARVSAFPSSRGRNGRGGPTLHQTPESARRFHEQQGSGLLKTDAGYRAWNQLQPQNPVLRLRPGSAAREESERLALDLVEARMDRREGELRAQYPHMSKKTLDDLLLAELAKERKVWEEEKNRKMAQQRRAREAEDEAVELERSAKAQLDQLELERAAQLDQLNLERAAKLAELEKEMAKKKKEIVEAEKKKREEEKEMERKKKEALEEEKRKKKQAEQEENTYTENWDRWSRGQYNVLQRQELAFREEAEAQYRVEGRHQRFRTFMAGRYLAEGMDPPAQAPQNEQALQTWMERSAQFDELEGRFPAPPLFGDSRPRPSRMPTLVYEARRARGMHEEMDALEDRRREEAALRAAAEETKKQKEKEAAGERNREAAGQFPLPSDADQRLDDTETQDEGREDNGENDASISVR